MTNNRSVNLENIPCRISPLWSLSKEYQNWRQKGTASPICTTREKLLFMLNTMEWLSEWSSKCLATQPCPYDFPQCSGSSFRGACTLYKERLSNNLNETSGINSSKWLCKHNLHHNGTQWKLSLILIWKLGKNTHAHWKWIMADVAVHHMLAVKGYIIS